MPDIPESAGQLLMTETIGNIQATNTQNRNIGSMAAGVLQGAMARNFDEIGSVESREITVRARVRLLDCWAPEIRGGTDAERRRGLASRDLMRCLSAGRSCVLHVPLGDFDRLDEAFSFGRLLGRVFVDGVDLAREAVESGHATRSKR